MKISNLFRPEGIIPQLRAKSKEELFRELVAQLSNLHPQLPRDAVLKGLADRELMMTTGIARNVALPHTHVAGLGQILGLLGISREGIEYQSLDGEKVHLVFCLVGDDSDPNAHILVLRNLALLLTNPEFLPSMLKAKGARDIATTLEQFESLTSKAFS